MTGVCTVFPAEDEERIRPSGQPAGSCLSFGSSCTNRSHHFVVSGTQLLRLLKQKVKLLRLKSRLADYPELISVRQKSQVIFSFDDCRVLTCPSLDALHLRMTLLPYDDDKTAFFCQFFGRLLCFPHMRACGVNDLQSPAFCLRVYFGAHAMGTKNYCIAGRKIFQRIAALYTLLFQ